MRPSAYSESELEDAQVSDLHRSHHVHTFSYLLIPSHIFSYLLISSHTLSHPFAQGRYAHYYAKNIAEAPAEGMARTKLKRLMKELGKLQKGGEGASAEGALPVNAEAAIFLMQVTLGRTSACLA